MIKSLVGMSEHKKTCYQGRLPLQINTRQRALCTVYKVNLFDGTVELRIKRCNRRYSKDEPVIVQLSNLKEGRRNSKDWRKTAFRKPTKLTDYLPKEGETVTVCMRTKQWAPQRLTYRQHKGQRYKNRARRPKRVANLQSLR